MAINLFEGLPGHGKTLEAVKLMAKKLAEGVNCASNIEGLDTEKMATYVETHNFHTKPGEIAWYKLLRKLKLSTRDPATEGTPRDQQGKLLTVSREELLEDRFYPDPDRPETVSKMNQGYSLFVDEAQEIYRRGKKLSLHIENYFTKHRHSVDPNTGVSSNIILITQDGDNLNQFVRSLVELTIVCRKMKKAGLNNVYITEFFDGGYQTQQNKIGDSRQFYDSSVYEIYKSYSGDTKGVEIQVDDRQNFWKNPIVYVFGVAMLALFFGGSKVLYSWTHPKSLIDAQKTQDKSAAPLATSPRPGPSGHPMQPSSYTAQHRATTRLVGYYTVGGKTLVVLQDENGDTHYQTSGAGTHLDGPRSAVSVDARTVASFTGAITKPEGDKK